MKRAKEFPTRRITIEVGVPVARMLEQLTAQGFGISIARTTEGLLLWALRAQIRSGHIKAAAGTVAMVRRIPDYPPAPRTRALTR